MNHVLRNCSDLSRRQSHARWLTSWPKLESATGRARKRRRRMAQRSANAADDKVGQEEAPEETTMPAYPTGKPWRVLWPHPHGNPDGVEISAPKRKIPRWQDIQVGWAKYKQTWEDGLRGEPSGEKAKQREGALVVKGNENEMASMNDIQENATRNMEIARQGAADLVEQTKETTGIRTQDDLRKMATDMMQIATECLKEFMAGYRQGRDEEIDRMLNEYFQEEPSTETATLVAAQKPKRRKPKRASFRNN